MMKKGWMIGLSVMMVGASAMAQAFSNWKDCYVSMNSGSGSEWYSFSGTPTQAVAGSFNGANLGSFEAGTDSLLFTGGLGNAAYSSAQVTSMIRVDGMSILWRVYEEGSSAGSWNTLAMTGGATDFDGMLTASTYQYSSSSSIDLLSGLSAGNYIFEVIMSKTDQYFDMKYYNDVTYMTAAGQSSSRPASGSQMTFTVTETAAPGTVPEPTTLALLGLGGAALALRRRFRA